MAAAPTKGYAWAFPAEFEPDDRRHSSSGESSAGNSHIPSRQNSFAASINSSIYTTDSQLPSGQKRLDNGTHTQHTAETLTNALQTFPRLITIQCNTAV